MHRILLLTRRRRKWGTTVTSQRTGRPSKIDKSIIWKLCRDGCQDIYKNIKGDAGISIKYWSLSACDHLYHPKYMTPDHLSWSDEFWRLFSMMFGTKTRHPKNITTSVKHGDGSIKLLIRFSLAGSRIIPNSNLFWHKTSRPLVHSWRFHLPAWQQPKAQIHVNRNGFRRRRSTFWNVPVRA